MFCPPLKPVLTPLLQSANAKCQDAGKPILYLNAGPDAYPIIGQPYISAIAASGGETPYTYSDVSGKPAWMTLNPSTGAISGTPTAGTSTVTFRVTDNASDTADDVRVFEAVDLLDITTTSLPGGTIGASYSESLAASGGKTPYTFNLLSGTLPSGLALASDGTISGTPTTVETQAFTARLTDASGQTDTQLLSIAVAALDITLTLTGNATVDEGSVYTLNIAASGDDAAGITGYTVNWGDGSATESATAGDNTHTYDDGPLSASIVVTALHPNGNKTASKSVTVGNVVPTATITGDSTATVDVEYTATISSVTDPGDDTVSTYRVYWGDGSSDDYASAGAKTHTYTSADTGLTVRLDLIDEDGTHTNVDSYSLDVSATVTPIHSLDLTTAPSASNAFDDYGLSLPRTVTDYNGRIVTIPADAVPMGGLRPVRNLWPTADGSDTPSTQVITVTSGRVYQLRIGAESASGATAVCSGAFTGTLTGDGADIQAFDTGKTATTTSLTVTITGSVRKIQLQDITHRSDLSTAPDEYVSTDDDYGTGVNGFTYFDTELANTVASNVVTEGTGASVDGWLDYQPGATNLINNSNYSSWTSGSISVTGDDDGVFGVGSAIEVTATGGAHNFRTGCVVEAETDYIFSFYVKRGTMVDLKYSVYNVTALSEIVSPTSYYSDTNNADYTRISVPFTTPAGCELVNVYPIRDSGVSGTVYFDHAQLEQGTIPTAPIPTSGSSASRPAMSPAPTISGLVGTEDARLTVKGLAADLVTPDPTDTTERTLDVDNTDGEFDTLPSPIQVLSIDVYNDGERPT